MSTSGEQAVGRAGTAQQRAYELDERLRRLRAGDPITIADVRQAEESAERQRALSAEAHRRAAETHRESARRHRQTSDLLEARGDAGRAEEHRRLAELDDGAGSSDDAAARVDEQTHPV